MSAPLRVLIVDDSAFARKVVREMLSSDPSINVVGTARDGLEALEVTASLKPDLVICDLHMPRMDGVGFVRQQMIERPLPILILSSASQDTEEVIDALNLGAVEVVTKPSALATDELRVVRDVLVAKVKAAAGVSLGNLKPVSALKPLRTVSHATRVGIVVVGISTGGPQALRRMIPMFAADFAVPIAVVLHMPVGYTALYAEKLNELSALHVKEAREGDAVLPGQVLIAPAGMHLTFRTTREGSVVARLTVSPLEKVHRPSVDVLFQSAAETFGGSVLAVVMTGMGDDGKEGAAWVKAQGGTVLTEAEKSCVIYGMPRSVDEAGLSDASITLDAMAQAISDRI